MEERVEEWVEEGVEERVRVSVNDHQAFLRGVEEEVGDHVDVLEAGTKEVSRD